MGLFLFIPLSVSFLNLNHSLTVGIGVLNEEKPKGSKVTTMVDGDKNGDLTGSCTTAKSKNELPKFKNERS